MNTRTLVSGAAGAASFAQLQPGTLVADEFGRLLGIVAGPYISPDPTLYTADADALLVVVNVDPEHPSYQRFPEVCISGRFLHPLEHGPLLDDDPEPSFKPGADAEAWHAAWNAWYARRQDLDEARRGLRATLEAIAERGTTLPPPDAAPAEMPPAVREWLRSQTVYDADAGVYYEPFVQDGRVGYRCASNRPGIGQETYLYFNPSTGSDAADHAPNVFVYIGEENDPAVDSAECYLNVDGIGYQPGEEPAEGAEAEHAAWVADSIYA